MIGRRQWTSWHNQSCGGGQHRKPHNRSHRSRHHHEKYNLYHHFDKNNHNKKTGLNDRAAPTYQRA